ncbi:MAG: dienelactone hydrolase family protein [Bacteroidota bacterium]
MRSNQLFLLLAASIVFISCNSNKSSSPAEDETAAPKLKEENVSYFQDNTTLKGYIVYDSSNDKKRPAVLVVHEWWGMNDYPKMRARKLAELGYVAMAVDMYGNGTTVDNPTDAQKMAMPFYQDPKMAKSRLEIFIHALKQYSQVDTSNMAAIGYCFGGGVLLNTARLGEDLKAVVSFHGSLVGTPADKNLLKANILVCHGADDKFVLQPEVEQFKKQMDSIGANYTFKQYPGATHAFSNPAATAMGQKFNLPIAYNAAADSASWNDMKEFFGRIFK